MTKQGEIFDGIDKVIRESVWLYWLAKVRRHFIVRKIIRYLHSQGVVIKVEGELPKNRYRISWQNEMESAKAIGWTDGTQDMLKAGYVAVEPLIEEK